MTATAVVRGLPGDDSRFAVSCADALIAKLDKEVK